MLQLSNLLNHTLVFANNFTTENATIGQGTYYLILVWNRSNSTLPDSSITSKLLQLTANNTLPGLGMRLRCRNGVTASIIQTAPSAYSLLKNLLG